ncbi:MAG TPA: R3H domain-containing nucleic acid-binding protein [Pyrinomonadaceae bacterium]|jgi:spoIIIJ-associated protein|nr:R3H domain-containing nucleic acid-binding protein [Pyrinomonadaceae bacterium]
MNANCEQPAEFLRSILDSASLSLNVTAEGTEEGCRLNIDGDDADLLIYQGGELLEALQHLINQALLKDIPRGQRVVCDAQGFRATREAELRAMAKHAADRVRSTGSPFMFGAMTANERRIIHLTLSEEADLFTESVGEGHARKLKVSRK